MAVIVPNMSAFDTGSTCTHKKFILQAIICYATNTNTMWNNQVFVIYCDVCATHSVKPASSRRSASLYLQRANPNEDDRTMTPFPTTRQEPTLRPPSSRNTLSDDLATRMSLLAEPQPRGSRSKISCTQNRLTSTPLVAAEPYSQQTTRREPLAKCGRRVCGMRTYTM